MAVPGELRSAALRPLWLAVHERLSSGRPVNRVRVGPLDDEQRSAVADLLGLDRLPPRQPVITLARLDEVLREAAGVDTRSVVAELLGPLGDRAADRARSAAERAELWQWLFEHTIVSSQPALRDWAAHLRRTGLVNGSVPRTRELLDVALTVLERLPATGEPLPSFAEAVTGDPHALDEGTRLAGVVLRALAVQFGTEPPGNADQRRQLWERAGVAVDEMSTVVLAAGLRPAGDPLACRIARACAGEGQAAALTLAQLRHLRALELPGGEVWVTENPSVLAKALRRFGSRCPPLVCTAGWPSSAGILLLRLLAAAGNRLHYHGDLDGEGVRIAAYVLDKTNAEPWRMSTSDYLAALGERSHGPGPGRITDAPWDAHLAAAMHEHGVAVVEERVIDVLLSDLEACYVT
ncbi:MAG TPA: TIGR02679 family protein [Amycolatopsis sp.]|uniref:TIGR02679 family protein n=1 Tax=Amycolatopsis sp. TaxID=37632 RepID=UPI002B496555|nr:TIGR02679 family protein [Amycolatopsis sp.]HKS50057.1 TIGR02679 family protein [Amycolatopsis sp.]